jgi:hypothetical protein
MDLHFVSPRLSELDGLESEVLACSVFEDVRPCEGVAGLCDWRLGGRIANLMRSGFVSGARGELMLLPGRPRMSFEKILLFGAGPHATFDEECFREVMLHMLRAVEGLGARVAVVQLPGRQNDLITAERAADMLLEAAAQSAARKRHDLWTLVEDGDARRRIEQHMIEERRRVRRVE